MTPSTSFLVKHQLPNRVRIDFGARLSGEQLRSVIWLLEHHDPAAVVRPVAAGRGLVICSLDPERPLEDPLPRLEQLLNGPLAHLPEPPPRGLNRLIRQSRQGTIRVLISLAIAGWILPLMPGTPFFLLAWWMGWRPQPRPGGSASDPAQENPSSSQGASTRAERQVS